MALNFSLLSATVMIAHQVAGKSARDALFLSHFEVVHLPKIVIAAAIASLCGVVMMSWLLGKMRPVQLVPVVFVTSALLFIGEWLLYGVWPGVSAVVLYLHMATFGAILISGFWSVINERFDPHSAKRRVARIAAAATLGGVLGGFLAARVVALIDVRAMLLLLSVLHLVCAITVYGIGGARHPVRQEQGSKVRSGVTIIARTRYLQLMALLIIAVAVVAALLDYAFKAAAASRYLSGEELAAFFASFYAIAGVVGFALQTILGPRLLQRFGISTTIAILPGSVACLGFISALVANFWTVVLLRGSHSVLVNSFHRSAFELLYTPLAPASKRPTKTIIDVAGDRIGDMLGAGLILALLAALPQLPSAVVVGFATVVALMALLVIRLLHRGYVAQLASSLRKGTLSLQGVDILDATTQKVMAETSARSEREFLAAKMEAKAQGRDGNTTAGVPRPASPTGIPTTGETGNFLAAAQNLASGNVDLIRETLNGDYMDVKLAPYLIPLLGHEAVAEDARTELRWIVPRIIGQLADALFDPDLSLLARQRIPSVLEACHNPRATVALLQGLEDDEFNVRYSCARAIARMQARNPRLNVPVDTVLDAVRREVEVTPEEWQSRRLTQEKAPAGEDRAQEVGEGSGVNLEQVFTLLGLAFDREALRRTRGALTGGNANLRGTALEYLENILPEDIRRLLWQHLEVG